MSAFMYCFSLTSITIPNSVTSIGVGVFAFCRSLNSITVAAGNAHYDSRNNCNAIIQTDSNILVAGCSTTVIPNTVTSIGDRAFYYCSGLTSIAIPNSVTSIGNSAFRGCSGLTSVTIPNSVTSIGNDAFYGCSGLTSVTIGNSVTFIGNNAFGYCTGLTSITIPNSVTSIGNCAVYYCGGLSSITIGNSVTSIGNCAFYYCSGLTSVTIPNSVTSIGDTAFYGCSGLTGSLTIPNSVTSIGNSAFRGCSALTSVTIGGSVSNIGDYAFRPCNRLDTINSLPHIPPTIGSSLPVLRTGLVFNVPCGAYNNYSTASRWRDYRNYMNELSVNFNISVLSDNDSMGMATIDTSGGRTVDCDSSAIVQATANRGYHFDHWNNGNTANPDTLHLVGDSAVTAFFAPNTYHLTANVNDVSLGSVSMPVGDSALYKDTLMVVASPVAHYHVANWQGQNIVGVSANKDTAWVRIYGDCSVTCHFAIDTYSVAVVSSDIVRGSVTGGGTFVYGTPCTVEATAYTGYTFHSWSNGVTANPYTFAVLNDMTLTAIFLAPGEETYTVTVSVNDPTMGTATVNGNAAATVMSGETVTLLATPNVGYRFVKWSDENTEASRTVTVTRDMSFTATFVSTQGIEDAASANLNIYAKSGRICVSLDGQTTDEFSVYDVMGRRAAHVIASDKSPVLPAGVYIVKVGTLPARKVVVIR